MEFYLARHGEARLEAEDPLRPLSSRGREEVARVAQAAVTKGAEVFAILHSDKLRAKQTAEILARYLCPPGGVSQIGGLAPNDDPMISKAEIETAENSVMLVGHLPHLGRLASLLVRGDANRDPWNLPAGGILCLQVKDAKWQAKWTLSPDSL